jgi:hypothetical protein
MKLHKLSLTILATMVCGAAFGQGILKAPAWTHTMIPMRPAEIDAPAVPFYTNLVTNTCTSCNYSAVNGFLVLGPTNCFASGSTQWLAYPFVSAKSGVVKSLTAGITLDADLCTNGANKCTLALYSDACGGPATLLASAVATVPAAPCATVTVTLRRGPTLTLGTNYWIVATTATGQELFTGVWWQSNAADSYVNFNDGNNWQESPLGGPGAFSVQ